MSETDEALETTDRVKPWTVKGIAPEERNAAIAAADREGLTIGEWLTRAIRTQVQADHRSDRLPVTLDPPASLPPDRQSDLADLERVVELAKTLASANGEPIPPGITRATYSLMREHLKALKAGRTAAGVYLTGRPSGQTR
jgi:hypothetical protein